MSNKEQIKLLGLIAINETVNLSLWNKNVQDKTFVLNFLEEVKKPEYKTKYGNEEYTKTFLGKIPDDIKYDKDVFNEILNLNIYKSIFDIDKDILKKIDLDKELLLKMARTVKNFAEDLNHNELSSIKQDSFLNDDLQVQNYLKFPVNISKEKWDDKNSISYLKKLMLNPNFKSELKNKVPYSFVKELVGVRRDIKENLNLVVFLTNEDKLEIEEFKDFLISNKIGNVFLSVSESFEYEKIETLVSESNILMNIVENDITEYETLPKSMKSNKDLILLMAKNSKDPKQAYLSNVNTVMAEDNKFMETLFFNIAENSDFLLSYKNKVLENLNQYMNLKSSSSHINLAHVSLLIMRKQNNSFGDNCGYILARNEKLKVVLERCGYISKQDWSELISNNPGIYKEAASYLEESIMSDNLQGKNNRRNIRKF